MFERYTEKARRVIFFARYEASQVGSPAIESEHILFGLLREDRSILSSYLGNLTAEGELRLQVLTLSPPRNPTSTSIDLPLSEECQRILGYSSEEAARLEHRDVGTEHLLLGILREQDCLAAKLLSERGLRIEQARVMIHEAGKEGAGRLGSGPGPSGRVRTSRATVQLIDAERLQPLGELSGATQIPRVGESLSLRDASGQQRVFRVQDVLWQTEQEAETHRLRAIVVHVRKQAPGQQS